MTVPRRARQAQRSDGDGSRFDFMVGMWFSTVSSIEFWVETRKVQVGDDAVAIAV